MEMMTGKVVSVSSQRVTMVTKEVSKGYLVVYVPQILVLFHVNMQIIANHLIQTASTTNISFGEVQHSDLRVCSAKITSHSSKMQVKDDDRQFFTLFRVAIYAHANGRFALLDRVDK